MSRTAFNTSEWNDGVPRTVYREHRSIIEKVVWSPVSSMIASCAVGEGVRVWDAMRGTTRTRYDLHSDSIRDIAFSPNGCSIATCSDDGTVHVWETATGILQKKYTGHRREVLALAWSPEGNALVSLDETAVHVWHISPSDRVMVFGREYELFFSSLLWCCDGRRIVTASDGTLHIWDAMYGILLASWAYGEEVTIVAIAESPDGTRIAIAGDDARVFIVHAMTGEVMLSHPVALDASWGLTWLSDGLHVVSSGYAGVELWNAESGNTCWTYGGHTGSVNTVACSSDGAYLASGSEDWSIHVWPSFFTK